MSEGKSSSGDPLAQRPKTIPPSSPAPEPVSLITHHSSLITSDKRWPSLFRRSCEPIFLLNHQRRFLFVNPAWEELTGLSSAEMRGFACMRRAPVPGDPWDVVVRSLCCPPAEVLAGRPGRVRRPVPGVEAPRRRWDVEFFPIQGPDRLLCVLGKITPVLLDAKVASAPLPAKLIALREKMVQWHNADPLPREIPTLRRLSEQIHLASQTTAPALIVGAPGTGKEWLARAIHYQGAGREQVFMAIDCAGLPPMVLADILFADGGPRNCCAVGTVYLREPARLPRDLQSRLAQWLTQPDSDRPRVLAGTSTVPADDVRSGALLEELHCALATLVFELPPLRDRRAELSWFIEKFLERAGTGTRHQSAGLTPEAVALIHAYPWPGNLRELSAVLTGALAHADDRPIDARALPMHLRLGTAPAAAAERRLSLDEVLEQVERRLIVLALRKFQGHKGKAAEFLSIWRQRLVRRMEALGLANVQPAESQDVEIDE